MKLRIICPHCVSESEERKIYLPGDLAKFELMYAEEVTDDGRYKIICSQVAAAHPAAELKGIR